MKSILKLLILSEVLIFMAFSCEKEEVQPANEEEGSIAEGTIIETFAQCYGYWIMIEVEKPQGIGKAGSYTLPGQEDSPKTYYNAIGVPYFERIPGLKTEAPDTIGTWLRFKYRELTHKERCDKNLFRDTSFVGICNAMIGPPDVSMYMITKILDYH